MKFIPSTYHQMVSYLTEARQVDLIRNQLAAWQCYKVTVETKQIDPAADEPKSLSSKSQ